MQNRLQRLFLYHIWACAPFALTWMIAPQTFAHPFIPAEITPFRLIILIAACYLSIRTWFVLRGKSARIDFLWPYMDVVFISVALYFKQSPADSRLVFLYLIPLVEAAATLRYRRALPVALLAVAGYLIATGVAGLLSLQYSAAAFRLSFFIIMASLLTGLGRVLADTHRELALAAYRNELAAEMHDGIQQYLAAITLRLDYAQRLAATNPAEAAHIAVEQRHLARQAADELRIIVRRLKLISPAGETIADSLRQYALILEQRSPLHIDVRVTGQVVPLDFRVEHMLFRIIQEALNNVMKHARATQVVVDLAIDPDRVSCQVRDDGIGFDPSALPENPGSCFGLGLQTMSQRAAELGGTFHLDSRHGSGTTVAVTVPCQRK